MPYLIKVIESKKIDYTVNNDGSVSIGGNLDLEGTGITSLPDNLSVGGSLHLRGTGITSLPDNLSVGGYLYLEGTGITSLPDNLSVGDGLYLRGTGITSLPALLAENTALKAKNIELTGNLSATTLSINNVSDALGLSGDGAFSLQVITKFTDLRADNRTLRAMVQELTAQREAK